MKEDQKPLINDIILFGQRFLESYAGLAILKDPKIAIMELIANSWDAGATKVKIEWPIKNGDTFRIADNGHGMSDSQFNKIWRTLAYDRVKDQGLYAEFPVGIDIKNKRPVFGRNGKGRFAGFCFGNKYEVRTWRDGLENIYLVSKGTESPFKIKKMEEKEKVGHGTEIYISESFSSLGDERIKAEIGMRFLSDPNFKVFLNDSEISFKDIPKKNLTILEVEIESKKIEIIVIDVQDTDRTTHQHGIAWHVNKRLVGECTWKGSGQESFIDGRRIEAKRYAFIVIADILANAIQPDWSGFLQNHPSFQKVNKKVQAKIREHLLFLTKGKREEVYKEIEATHRKTIKQLKQVSPLSFDKWKKFVYKVQEKCPSITQSDLVKLSGILANLESSNSKFSLINQLHELSSTQLDKLDNILKEWTLDLAKVVLDELRFRLRLLEELKTKIDDNTTYEVQELQPLFHIGLWIFGPEYESMEFTSNEGMTSVIQKIFKKDDLKGSRMRPDFVIIPDGTAGFYSYPSYDEDGGEDGIDKLVILELKKPGVRISDKEKSQCWKYIKELLKKGLIDKRTRVIGLVLGTIIDPHEADERTYLEGMVKIKPLNYSTVVVRAKSRLLKLYDKVKGAPFLNKASLDEFLNESVGGQGKLEFDN